MQSEVDLAHKTATEAKRQELPRGYELRSKAIQKATAATADVGEVLRRLAEEKEVVDAAAAWSDHYDYTYRSSVFRLMDGDFKWVADDRAEAAAKGSHEKVAVIDSAMALFLRAGKQYLRADRIAQCSLIGGLIVAVGGAGLTLEPFVSAAPFNLAANPVLLEGMRALSTGALALFLHGLAGIFLFPRALTSKWPSWVAAPLGVAAALWFWGAAATLRHFGPENDGAGMAASLALAGLCTGGMGILLWSLLRAVNSSSKDSANAG